MENNQDSIQAHKLAMTQQMRQAIKILQLSAHELNEYLEDQLMSNPMLNMPEAVEKQCVEAAEYGGGSGQNMQHKDQSIDWKEYHSAKDYSNHDHFYYDDNDVEYNAIERIPYEDSTLIDYLMLQLDTCSLSEGEYHTVSHVIEAIDETGYLAAPLEEISCEAGVGIAEIENAVRRIQQFDPPGVGAANLKECLLIQIDQLSQSGQDGVDYELPCMIIKNHLGDLANNKLANITRAQHVSTLEAQKACDFIRSLEPKPGRNFKHDAQTEYIIPDIVIEEGDGDFVINISEKTAPRLRINQYYKKFLSNRKKDAEITKYVNEKLNSASWLIKSIEQRRNTIYKLVESILLHQKEFFEKGKANLKHLTLKQVADDLGVHVSTVSRAASNKYLMCKYGVFELKYFFDSGVPCKSERRPSSKSVLEIIGKLIKTENVKHPLADRQIVEMLTEQGIELSRRTVAKYRTALGIQSSAKRRRY